MISRYALYDIADIGKRFNLSEGLPKGVKPHYNISPTVSAPIIVNDEGDRIVTPMEWGLVAKGAKDKNAVFRYKTYNIPSEKILSRHSWEKAVRESRCLIPANGFYTMNESGKKRAFYAKAKDDSLLAFAGVHSSWEDPDGTVHDVYSLITTETSDDMLSTDSRMPIIITPEDEDRWLDTSLTDANTIYDMLRSYPIDQLDVYEVSTAVYSPKPNQKELASPI